MLKKKSILLKRRFAKNEVNEKVEAIIPLINVNSSNLKKLLKKEILISNERGIRTTSFNNISDDLESRLENQNEKIKNLENLIDSMKRVIGQYFRR